MLAACCTAPMVPVATAVTPPRWLGRQPLLHRCPTPVQFRKKQGRFLSAVKAFQHDKEAAASSGGGEDFAALAKHLTGQLVTELASNKDDVYSELESWLVGSHDEGDLPPRTDQTTEESDGKRLMRLAEEVWGMSGGVTDVVQSVKSWLSNPAGGEEQHDSQLVARLVHRLLQSYEKQVGDEFDPQGPDHQYDRLYSIARQVLGSSVSRSVLKSLVRAYLDVGQRR